MFFLRACYTQSWANPNSLHRCCNCTLAVIVGRSDLARPKCGHCHHWDGSHESVGIYVKHGLDCNFYSRFSGRLEMEWVDMKPKDARCYKHRVHLWTSRALKASAGWIICCGWNEEHKGLLWFKTCAVRPPGILMNWTSCCLAADLLDMFLFCASLRLTSTGRSAVRLCCVDTERSLINQNVYITSVMSVVHGRPSATEASSRSSSSSPLAPLLRCKKPGNWKKGWVSK